uniref:Brain chitinase and chia n=1 Tax=Daphnia galeata TaxID=27404 RepID=A0A8J2RZS6_9CRUS|nr:unnamed protein product [Daphnia galeata]
MKLVVVLALSLLVTLANAQGSYKKVCYFANWAYYRNGLGQYGVDKLDAFECTHLIYGFSVLDSVTYEMKVYDSWVDIDLGGYQTFTGLKKQNPNLKTLIALGGWNDSAFSTQYSELVSDPVKMANFVEKALAFVLEYNFDGLDFDWEYPADPGTPEDKENFITLLRLLRDAFKPHNLLLTIASSCSQKRAEMSYDIPALAEVLDFVNFMAYDIHGAWENQVDHHTPLYRRDYEEGFEAVLVAEAVDFWLESGMPSEKLIFGLPSYGRTWRLQDSTKTDLLSPAIGAGPLGPYTGQDGFISLYEIPFSNAITATLEGRPFDTSTPAPTPTLYPKTTQRPITCTSNGQYFADPADCNKYYRCVNGEVVTLYCETGLVFNSKDNVCDWPYNVPGCY